MIILEINDVKVQVDTPENAVGILKSYLQQNETKVAKKIVTTKAVKKNGKNRKKGYRAPKWSDDDIAML